MSIIITSNIISSIIIVIFKSIIKIKLDCNRIRNYNQTKMMNYVIVNGACCCLQLCCKQLSETAYKIIGRIAFVKLMHTILYFSVIVFVFIAMYLLRQWEFFMRVFADGISCKSITNDFDCISASVIYRIMLSLFMFSTLMLLIIMVTSARIAKIINQSLFVSKFVITILLFLLTLQFSDTFITYFSNFAQIFSYIFIVWQIIIIIDLAYLWGIKWAEHYNQGSQIYGCLLIIFTIINYLLSIGLNSYGYVLSKTNDTIQGQCRNYPNILSTIFIVLMFGVQLLNFNKQNSLLATSALSIFSSYWLLSAIFSQQSCNNTLIFQKSATIIGKSDFLKANIPISVVFVILSSFGSIYGSSNKEKGDQFIELQQNIPIGKDLKPEEQESLEGQQRLWLRWHSYMLAMSLYISMIMTDWGSGDILNGKFSLTQNAQVSKIFTASATFVLYIWTLLAPKVLKGRNFQFN